MYVKNALKQYVRTSRLLDMVLYSAFYSSYLVGWRLFELTRKSAWEGENSRANEENPSSLNEVIGYLESTVLRKL